MSQPIIHRLVYELRYPHGFIYLDKCGKTLNELLSLNDKSETEWSITKAAPDAASVNNNKKNMAFNFNANKIDMSQIMTKTLPVLDIKDFAITVDKLSTIVFKNLNITEFSRIGFRVWNMIPCCSEEEAKEKIKGLKFLKIELASEIGTSIEDLNVGIHVNRGDHDARIFIAGGKQKINFDEATIEMAQSIPHKRAKEQNKVLRDKLKAKHLLGYFPKDFLMIDIDYYVKDPPLNSLNIQSFMIDRFKDNRELVGTILSNSI
jgi:hypothetical protein